MLRSILLCPAVRGQPRLTVPSSIVRVGAFSRPFSLSQRISAPGSLFGEVTQLKPTGAEDTSMLTDNNGTPAGEEASMVSPQKDTKLQEYYAEQVQNDQVSRDKYVSAIKRKLFDANVAKNGFFKNNQVVIDPELGKKYMLRLTPEEIDLLEPTIYLHLYRIKSSMKKATVVNRFVRGMLVKTAINQLHFNPKKMATELEKFLKHGLEQCRKGGIDEDSAYIQALWTGSDGGWVKRPDIKGRGRTGIIEHPYIHLKAILKTSLTKKRLAWEDAQKRLSMKPRVYMNTDPLNFPVRGLYRW